MPWPPGIIPARAGFTEVVMVVCGGLWDHPRSRGVYSFTPSLLSQYCGSSPLARGLPAVAVGGAEESGIIPARAGFTAGAAFYCIATEDHPRSRGVYDLPAHARRPGEGSSPLARGLHLDLVHDAPFRGIIPARAGFTLPR
mgnify:CR=1 FL=1